MKRLFFEDYVPPTARQILERAVRDASQRSEKFQTNDLYNLLTTYVKSRNLEGVKVILAEKAVKLALYYDRFIYKSLPTLSLTFKLQSLLKVNESIAGLLSKYWNEDCLSKLQLLPAPIQQALVQLRLANPEEKEDNTTAIFNALIAAYDQDIKFSDENRNNTFELAGLKPTPRPPLMVSTSLQQKSPAVSSSIPEENKPDGKLTLDGDTFLSRKSVSGPELFQPPKPSASYDQNQLDEMAKFLETYIRLNQCSHTLLKIESLPKNQQLAIYTQSNREFKNKLKGLFANSKLAIINVDRQYLFYIDANECSKFIEQQKAVAKSTPYVTYGPGVDEPN